MGAMYGPVVCDPESHAFVGVSRLSSNAAELTALMFAVRGICVAMQLEKEEQGKEVLPVLDASFVSDNMYALGVMQFQTRAATNHGQAQLARRWSWASRAALSNKYRHVRAHPGVLGNEFADVGAELGRWLRCTSLSWLREDLPAKNEGIPFSSYDALWWSDQLSKPDPLMDRGVDLRVTNCGLELCVGSANVRTLSPGTDDLVVHSVRGRVLADAFSKKSTSMLWVCRRRARAIQLAVFVVVVTWSRRPPCLPIWVRNCLCDAGDIFVLHSTARILVIRVSFRISPLLVCSAHAHCEPRDPREEAASMAWWMELGDAVVQHRWTVGLSSCASKAKHG